MHVHESGHSVHCNIYEDFSEEVYEVYWTHVFHKYACA